MLTDPENHFYRDGRYHGQPTQVADWCQKGNLIHELGHVLRPGKSKHGVTRTSIHKLISGISKKTIGQISIVL
jgi:hypothetical protein